MCILLFLTSCLIFLRYSRPGFVHTTCIWTLGQSYWEKWRAWGRKQGERMRNKWDRKESRCFSAPCSRWVWAANCHWRLCSAVMPQWTKNTFIKRKFPRPIYAFEVLYFMRVAYWEGSAEGHGDQRKWTLFKHSLSLHIHTMLSEGQWCFSAGEDRFYYCTTQKSKAWLRHDSGNIWANEACLFKMQSVISVAISLIVNAKNKHTEKCCFHH